MRSKVKPANTAAGTNIGNSSVVSAIDTTYPAPTASAPFDSAVLIISDHVHVVVFSPTVAIVFSIPMKASWKA